MQNNYIENFMSFSRSIVKVKLSGSKYSGGQYFFQKYIAHFLMTGACMIFQKAVNLVRRECMLFVDSYLSSKGCIYIRNSVTRKNFRVLCVFVAKFICCSYRTMVQISLQIGPLMKWCQIFSDVRWMTELFVSLLALKFGVVEARKECIV